MNIDPGSKELSKHSRILVRIRLPAWHKLS